MRASAHIALMVSYQEAENAPSTEALLTAVMPTPIRSAMALRPSVSQMLAAVGSVMLWVSMPVFMFQIIWIRKVQIGAGSKKLDHE